MAKRNSKTLHPPATPVVPKLRDGDPALLSVLLFALTALVFLPATRHGFLSFEDGLYGLYGSEDPHVQRGLSWENLRWAFTTLHAGTWHPLTWLSHMLDCELFGLRAAEHHLVSVLIHASSTVLLFRVMRRMTGTMWRSAMVAALFGLHPLRAEPVAWAADRRDVLVAFFWMLALLAYIRFAESLRVGARAKAWYALTFLWFACGLMSKTTIIVFPLAALLLDWWPLQRLQFAELRAKPMVLIEKLPFLAAGLVPALVTLHGQAAVGSATGRIPLPFRLHIAVLGYVQYLRQTLWPDNLAVFYPYPETLAFWAAVGAALLLLMVTALVLRAARTHPYLAVGWFWYLVTLLPNIQLIQIGPHARADRFMYIPSIGIFVMLVWGAADLTHRWRNPRTLRVGAALALLAGCAALTHRQLGYWADSETLFRRALAVTRGNYLAHYNVARALNERGETAEALGHLEAAVRCGPNYALSHYLLGTVLLARSERVDEAKVHLLRAVELQPNLALGHNNLGVIYAREGRLEEAVEHFETALKLRPDYASARENLLAAQEELKKAPRR